MIFSTSGVYIFDYLFSLILELTLNQLVLKIQPKAKKMHEIDKCNYNNGRKNKYQVMMMMLIIVLFCLFVCLFVLKWLTSKSALVQSPFLSRGHTP